ncbi:hypothetical protein AAU57_08645 [Nonlabens sp. YIK11]|uniref:RagB/SusD family nutrient uptake outer membrane protein n=1 Tax=Nonlabens sp. YIK11 TaxID=1453349 RepID=UPI0006DCF495|nr:RagB/SusD family nutrient uptake outer membrane protein [Nonlabens sp. YIK11]KQC33373.1 hypothetical protein AAU57_08645 [Nonlabens sp. YIK11]
MKINSYICALLSAFLLTACSDDFIDKEPITQISTGNLYQTQEDAEAVLISCYDGLQPDSYYGFDMLVYGDVRSDNCFAGGDNAANFQIDNFNVNPTNAIITRSFSQMYSAINRANTVLNRVEQMDEALFDTGRKEGILGEALFLRGLHYFNLVRLFGDVPLVTTETTSLDPAQLNVSRTAQQEVYNQIITDLLEAQSLLPDVPVDPERAAKGAAEALLSKVYLTLEDYPNVDVWTEAVMRRGYGLQTRFDNLFNQENKFNNEVIFAVRYLGDTEGNVFPELVLPTPEASFDFIKFNTPTPNSINQFQGGDSRAASSFVQRNGESFLYKWRNGEAFQSADYTIVLRYADVLLMRAEALNQINRTGDAIDLLNRVRLRAGLPNYGGQTDPVSVDDAIFQERRLEFMYEGHRWFDLKRKGFAAVTEALDESKDISISEFELLLPIPQTELDRNPNLTQNPGY